MMVSAFEVYTQVMSLSRKLEVQREVQESARAITEAIAKDVREKGFIITKNNGDIYAPSGTLEKYFTGTQLLINTGSIWWQIFNIGYSLKWKNITSWVFDSCTNISSEDCILVKKDIDSNEKSLVSGRVRLTSLTFEEIGENVGGAGGIGGGINVGISTLPKVRLLMTLEARPGSGISSELIESTKLHIDTVFSTKMYKAD